MLLHPNHGRRHEDVDVSCYVLPSEVANAAYRLQRGEAALQHVLVWEADLDEGAIIHWLLQQRLEFHLSFALKSCVVNTHQLLPILLNHGIGVGAQLVLECHLAYIYLLLLVTFVVYAGLAVRWWVAHCLRAVLD